MSELENAPEIIRLDGKGGGEPIPWADVARTGLPEGLCWFHLNWSTQLAHQILVETLSVDPVVAESLVEEDTRPRSVAVQGAEMVILRGVNLTPGAEPEDMISLRILITADRIITLMRRELRSIPDLRQALLNHSGPATAGEFLAFLIERLVDWISPVVAQLEDAIDEEEDDLVEGKISHVEATLVGVRGRIIKLRRFLAPQRDALVRLCAEKLHWIEPTDRARLRESADQLTRYVEDLDEFRERAQVIQEEITVAVNRRLVRSTFIITLGASVLVPLNLVTGLFGMNVGGIPGKESPYAFPLIALGFVVLLVLAFLWGRRRLG